jgi:hypothetical protein
MKPPSKKSPPKKRNLAAKALSEPAFRPKIMENPAVKKRRNKFNKNPADTEEDDEIN